MRAKYETPGIRTLAADEVIEAVGPVQGYGGSGITFGPNATVPGIAADGTGHLGRNY